MSEDPTFDDNRDADRRESEDRRQDGADVTDDRRVPEQAERRLSTDRRGWPFGLILRTTESYRVIEEWLDDNCSGKWGFGLEDMDENLAQKSFKVMFELEEDKIQFVTNFSRN
jgi:hypothetical protein